LVYNESKKNYAAIIQEKNIERIKYVIKKLNKRQLRESIIDAEKANETALKNLDKLYIVE
jgi:hypothetical protein